MTVKARLEQIINNDLSAPQYAGLKQYLSQGVLAEMQNADLNVIKDIAPYYHAVLSGIEAAVQQGVDASIILQGLSEFAPLLQRAYELELLKQQQQAILTQAQLEAVRLHDEQQARIFVNLRRNANGMTTALLRSQNLAKARLLCDAYGVEPRDKDGNKILPELNGDAPKNQSKGKGFTASFLSSMKNLFNSFAQPDENVRERAMHGFMGTVIQFAVSKIANVFKGIFGSKHAKDIDEVRDAAGIGLQHLFGNNNPVTMEEANGPDPTAQNARTYTPAAAAQQARPTPAPQPAPTGSYIPRAQAAAAAAGRGAQAAAAAAGVGAQAANRAAQDAINGTGPAGRAADIAVGAVGASHPVAGAVLGGLRNFFRRR